jgi:hypothetical protein
MTSFPAMAARGAETTVWPMNESTTKFLFQI